MTPSSLDQVLAERRLHRLAQALAQVSRDSHGILAQRIPPLVAPLEEEYPSQVKGLLRAVDPTLARTAAVAGTPLPAQAESAALAGKAVQQAEQELRQELLSTELPPSEPSAAPPALSSAAALGLRRAGVQLEDGSASMSDAEVQAEIIRLHALQESYKDDIAQMAAQLKAMAEEQSAEVRSSLREVDAVDASLDANHVAVVAENEHLSQVAKTASRATLCYWLIVLLTAVVFIVTVVAMRVIGAASVPSAPAYTAVGTEREEL